MFWEGKLRKENHMEKADSYINDKNEDKKHISFRGSRKYRKRRAADRIRNKDIILKNHNLGEIGSCYNF